MWARRYSLWMILLVIFVAGHAAESVVQVRRGNPPMVDGKFSNNEWSDAAHVDIANGFATFYAKRSGEFVWLGVRPLKNSRTTVDLYLSPADGGIYDLHASAKLGERKLENGTWPEWQWWNNQEWVANLSRPDNFEQKKFLPDEGREFQIRRSRFPGRRWKIMLEILVISESGVETTSWPAGAKNTDTRGWMVLQLP